MSHTEIMKQWITQNNLFEHHDHATVLSLLTHFDFELVSSHMTQAHFYCWLYAFFFFGFISVLMFFLLQQFETAEKFLRKLIN